MSFWQHVRKPKPLKDGERPHQLLWYLAGGRMTAELPSNGVPTAGTLRERRVVEEANRDAVGFWGIVRGRREVKISRKQLAEAVRRVDELTKETGSGNTEASQKKAERPEMQKPDQAAHYGNIRETREKADSRETEKPQEAPEAEKSFKRSNEISGLDKEAKPRSEVVERECGTGSPGAAPAELKRPV